MSPPLALIVSGQISKLERTTAPLQSGVHQKKKLIHAYPSGRLQGTGQRNVALMTASAAIHSAAYSLFPLQPLNREHETLWPIATK